MANRRVIQAVLYEPKNIPGVSTNVSKTLTECQNQAGAIKSLSMEWTDTVLELTFNGKIKAAVPHAGVASLVFSPEEPAKK